MRRPAAVRQAESMVAFESKPPAFLKGEYQPKDNTERLGLAGVCVGKKLNHAAAHLDAVELAADPKAAGDLKSFHRYNAAGHALLAAAGHGEDRFRSGSWLAVSCRLVLTHMEMACCLVMLPSRVPLQAERTCSASPVASRWADGSDKPKPRLANRFELSDAVSALRLPPKAVATVSGPTVRHLGIVTRLQRTSFGFWFIAPPLRGRGCDAHRRADGRASPRGV
jgi:hypothetical protein